MESPGKRAETIAREFSRAGLKLSPLELERFVLLDGLLLETKDSLDLTRIDDPVGIVVKHYVDGALAAELMAPEGLLMDLGSGAGFPGLPMAIRKPGWRFLLAEPRGKKLEFIDRAVELMGLDNVEVYPHKVTGSFDRPVWGVVTRDYLSVASAAELCARILPPGGMLYLLKGANAEREVAEAESAEGRRAFGPAVVRGYGEAMKAGQRRLVAMRKERGGAPPPPRWHNITEIASPGNSRFRGWLSLSDARGIRKRGQCIVSGRKAAGDLLSFRPAAIAGVIARRLDELGGLGIPEGVPVYLVRREIFPELDLFGTGPPLIVAEAAPLPAWDPSAPLLRDAFFAPFQDPANVGALVRTAAAMGADAVLLKGAASPYHPKALRASGPALWLTDVLAGPSLVELAALNSPNLFALTPGGTDLFSFRPPEGPVGLAMGLEGPGMTADWPEVRRLGIPMSSGVESLNAAVAAAVAMAVIVKARLG
ncbi:MAG: class I SAM-dependent methyltransferase [Deltaproteobacteria bacterium]|jgi:16S rRNA (guanine(527)-N(7))-methyltransferase RsmG|nr:class I SAM-dependent methyltransferase [Deltaproteobacteria bacterium]